MEKSKMRVALPVDTKGQHPMEARTPVKLFDDLYFVGHSLCGSWVIKTSEGLVLIDASGENDFWEQILNPGLEKLGLGEEKILAILLTHGHMDHYAGCGHIQQATGCDIYLSKDDIVYMMTGVENDLANHGRDPHNPTGEPIPMFMVNRTIEDGQDLVFGDHTIHCLLAPGHTPGCLNYSMEVHEGEETHRFVMMGGYGIFGPGNFPGQEYPYGKMNAQKCAFQFAYACVQLWEYVKENNADIFFNPHPHLCDMYQLAEKNEQRKPGDPNAFVIGQEGVREWIVERYYECLESAARFTDLTVEM